MSFITEINTILTSDSSLNALIDGGIHYQNLPDNYLGNNECEYWIVYDMNKNNQEDCINSKNVFMTYNMNVVLIQRRDNDQIDTITSMLINLLNNHESGNIIDIGFTGDSNGFNQQEETYTNVLSFTCIYIEN